MKISARAAVLCAAAGVLAYLNSPGGTQAALLALAAGGAAFAASFVARGRAGRIERKVTEFAKSLLSKQFPRYEAQDQAEENMSKALNAAARDLKSRFEETEQRNTRFAGALDLVSDGVLCVSSAGLIKAANKTAHSMLGASGGIVGRNYWEVIFSPQMRRLIEDAFESGEPVRREVANLYPSETFYTVVAAPGKGLKEVSLVLFDSTRLKKMEIAQKDLITNISHEIRTPLTSIIGAVEGIASKSEDEETEKFSRILKRNTKRLTDLCSRIISFSELEQKPKNPANFAHFNLSEAVKNAVQLMRTEADKKNINMEIAEETPEIQMKGDRLMIENMFVNLIENAVKYSHEGGKVEVSVKHGEKGEARVCVKDFSEGIEEKDMGRIFERFYRGSRGGNRKGSGLGLSIARQTAEIHGGSIGVESEPGRGSAFTVYFHLKEKT